MLVVAEPPFLYHPPTPSLKQVQEICSSTNDLAFHKSTDLSNDKFGLFLAQIGIKINIFVK